MNAVKTAPKTVELSAVEKKLLKQIQDQAKPQPSWIKFLGNTHLGFI